MRIIFLIMLSLLLLSCSKHIEIEAQKTGNIEEITGNAVAVQDMAEGKNVSFENISIKEGCVLTGFLVNEKGRNFSNITILARHAGSVDKTEIDFVYPGETSPFRINITTKKCHYSYNLIAESEDGMNVSRLVSFERNTCGNGICEENENGCNCSDCKPCSGFAGTCMIFSCTEGNECRPKVIENCGSMIRINDKFRGFGEKVLCPVRLNYSIEYPKPLVLNRSEIRLSFYMKRIIDDECSDFKVSRIMIRDQGSVFFDEEIDEELDEGDALVLDFVFNETFRGMEKDSDPSFFVEFNAWTVDDGKSRFVEDRIKVINPDKDLVMINPGYAQS
ncbi:hypothetical protein D6745_04355 [Candidatus Woesearchaeota archaeon]|nr:MAG: hypothetical protein D6745_04355 [Candidatus Woesearchaeota archaeon]